jgi:hypothetical protein
MKVQKDVTLDKNNLDVEWERQSNLMEEYTKMLAKSNKEYSDIKLLLDNIVSGKKLEWRLDGEIKLNGKTTKVTEGSLDNAIDVDEECIEQKKLLIEKQYEIDVLKGVVEALRNKKSALEYEVQLYLSGYFGSPNDQRQLLNKYRKDI